MVLFCDAHAVCSVTLISLAIKERPNPHCDFNPSTSLATDALTTELLTVSFSLSLW